MVIPVVSLPRVALQPVLRLHSPIGPPPMTLLTSMSAVPIVPSISIGRYLFTRFLMVNAVVAFPILERMLPLAVNEFSLPRIRPENERVSPLQNRPKSMLDAGLQPRMKLLSPAEVILAPVTLPSIIILSTSGSPVRLPVTVPEMPGRMRPLSVFLVVTKRTPSIPRSLTNPSTRPSISASIDLPASAGAK